jgi:hypothetical protein
VPWGWALADFLIRYPVHGNGFGRKPTIFIKPGDVIAVSADGVGR